MSEDTNVKESNYNTIFDDVFRTIAQKMPYLLIGLINEAFKTNYAEDVQYEQLRNEHYEKAGKIITDSIIQIGEHIYHIECQSMKDGKMVLRMFEYDFAIAMEKAELNDTGIFEVKFPESCVFYIRNHTSVAEYHEARIKFPDGQEVCYKVPTIKAADYSVDEIFEKHLLMMLPYYILRYEHFLKSKSTNAQKTEVLLHELTEINNGLIKCEEQGNYNLYADMVDLIKEIAEYIIPAENPLKERMNDIMGGKVLELASERIKKQGIEKGIEQERIAAIKRMLANHFSKEQILACGYSEDEYMKVNS